MRHSLFSFSDDFAIYFNDFGSFIFNVFDNVIATIFDNFLLKCFFFLPIALTVIFIIIDFIFDITDEASNFHMFNNGNSYFKYRYRYYRKKRRNNLDMNEVYKRSKDNADYKHQLKMKELNTFRENENLRHNHKLEENEMFAKRYSVPKHTKKSNVNLDIAYDEDFE